MQCFKYEFHHTTFLTLNVTPLVIYFTFFVIYNLRMYCCKIYLFFSFFLFFLLVSSRTTHVIPNINDNSSFIWIEIHMHRLFFNEPKIGNDALSRKSIIFAFHFRITHQPAKVATLSSRIIFRIQIFKSKCHQLFFHLLKHRRNRWTKITTKPCHIIDNCMLIIWQHFLFDPYIKLQFWRKRLSCSSNI